MKLIFDKSDKGREEIATRKHHLAAKLRALLVLIDGKHGTEDLLKKVSGLGLDSESIAELLHNGFIQGVTPDHAPVHPADGVAPIASGASVATTTPHASAGILPDGQTQLQALHTFFNETIKSTIGLRGFGLQLKVEKASTVDDFRELRQPYLDAVLKAKGNVMEHSLRDRLDQLLNYNNTPPV